MQKTNQKIFGTFFLRTVIFSDDYIISPFSRHGCDLWSREKQKLKKIFYRLMVLCLLMQAICSFKSYKGRNVWLNEVPTVSHVGCNWRLHPYLGDLATPECDFTTWPIRAGFPGTKHYRSCGYTVTEEVCSPRLNFN